MGAREAPLLGVFVRQAYELFEREFENTRTMFQGAILKERRSQDVLFAFKDRPDGLSTSGVAAILYPEEFARLEKNLNGVYVHPQDVRKAKTLKAKLHRRVLYHLNRLLEHEILRVARVDRNGEKYFVLNLDDNEEIIFQDFTKRKLVIKRPYAPRLPTEGYEEKHILVKFGGETWLESANAVLLEMEDLSELYRATAPLYAEVNDVVGVANFAHHANRASAERLIEFCKRVMADCRDFDRHFNLLVDASGLTEQGRERMLKLLRYSAFEEQAVKFIFETSPKELQENYDFFEEIFRTYGTRKIFFKNKELTNAPFLMGKAGPYTLDDREWKALEKKPKALVVAQTTLMIDMKKFCEAYTFSFTDFEDLILKTLRALFSASSVQRRRTESCFKDVLNVAGGRHAFALGRDYVRFWNYDFLRLAYDSKIMEGGFRLLKKRSREFCSSQEAIYTSCGMPARFRAVFSIANTMLSNDYFTTTLDRSRLEVSALKDFYSDDFREHMKAKELLGDIFDGGFQLTVHKKGVCQPDEAVREVGIMLSTYKIPFFAYAADAPQGTLKNLSTFVNR